MSDSHDVVSDPKAESQADVDEIVSAVEPSVALSDPTADIAGVAEQFEADSDSPNADSVSDAAIPVEESHFWLRRGDQVFVGVLLAVALVLGLIHWIRLSNWGREPIEIIRHESFQAEYRVDINKASWVEFAQLNGIGPILAQRIIESRKQDGPFVSINDLQRVNGIGPKKVEKMRPNLKPVEDAE